MPEETPEPRVPCAWDIASVTALFGLSNRVASVTRLMPNPEFHLMRRVPRERA